MNQGREKNRYDVHLRGGPLDGKTRFVLDQTQPTALRHVQIGDDVAVPLAPPVPGSAYYESTDEIDGDGRRVYEWRS